MNIHAHDAASASADGVQGSAKAFSRKVQAMREAMAEDYCQAPDGDLGKTMDQILREEEGK